ncbi:MAG: NAD(P)-dependent oxidoreductase [Burkholderiales bacterium]|nr:NAD(P)-dependent oxidoreductase [Anaerolineae bacterium]
MERQNIGILHPGEMGVSIAASAKNSGNVVYWVSEGRSAETRQRAASVGLLEVPTLERLCETCSVIVSVCPPDAAEDVAYSVLTLGFSGLYLDANAISPQRAERIGHALANAGVTFVDGGIIGGPAWIPGSTHLYLSGEESNAAAECFSAGPLQTIVISHEIGKASALKMCFAAYTKGATALLCAVMAAAEALDVRDALERQWSHEGSSQQNARKIQQVTAKAWRFAGEMHEIADTLEAVGMPGEFHTAAADVYQRLSGFKGAPDLPTLDDVLAALLHNEAVAAGALPENSANHVGD